jgi:hypothetical protein
VAHRNCNIFLTKQLFLFLQEHTEKFLNYVAQRNYHLLNVEEYGKILESVGFKNVRNITSTSCYFIQVQYLVGKK